MVRWFALVLHQARYAELLLEINLKILLRKTGARLNFKIALIYLHIDSMLPTNSLSSENFSEKYRIFGIHHFFT
jgi:hypothetical protein